MQSTQPVKVLAASSATFRTATRRDDVIVRSDTTFAERHCPEVWVVILRSAVGATKDLLVVNAPEILRALCALAMTSVIVILSNAVRRI